MGCPSIHKRSCCHVLTYCTCDSVNIILGPLQLRALTWHNGSIMALSVLTNAGSGMALHGKDVPILAVIAAMSLSLSGMYIAAADSCTSLTVMPAVPTSANKPGLTAPIHGKCFILEVEHAAAVCRHHTRSAGPLVRLAAADCSAGHRCSQGGGQLWLCNGAGQPFLFLQTWC